MLEAVVDPELHSSIVDLGMVRDVAVDEEGLISVEIALTIASCPLRSQIEGDVESRLRGLPGATGVEIRTSAMTAPERAGLMAKARKQAAERAPETEIPLPTRILAVASGKGGVGKSSVTVNLAAALAARGHTVGVLDADIWGFSVPRMLGVNARLGGAEGKIHPNEMPVPSVRPDGPAGTLKVVSMGFLVDDESMALMWRGLVLAKAVEQFLTDVRWGDLDYLLVDMPPGTGDIQMALSRLLPRAELLVVTTPALAAQKVAVRVADMARRSYLKVAGVVENMSAFHAPTGERYTLFGEGGGQDLADELDVPLLGKVPLTMPLREHADSGLPLVVADPDDPASQAIRHVARGVIAMAPLPLATLPLAQVPAGNGAAAAPAPAGVPALKVTQGRVLLSEFTKFRSLRSTMWTLLAAVVLGGMGTVPGALIGSTILILIPEKLRAFQDPRLLLFGVALILMMRLRPEGFAPSRRRQRELHAEGEGADALSAPPGTGR